MQQTYPARPTLAGALFPQTGLLRDLALILAFSAVVALSAQVSVRLWEIPLTGQTFAVLLTGAVLGRARGAAAMLAYIGEGLMGLPVFANLNSAWTPSPTSGVPYILGPTWGYLVGFVVAAYVVGWLAEHGWGRSVPTAVAAMVVGNLVIYAFGAGVLALFIGLLPALDRGIVRFLPGDIIKLALAAAALPGAWRLVGRRP